MPQSEKTVTGQQARAIDALLASKSIAEAADAAGVHRRTLERWMHDDAFKAALSMATAQSLAHSSRRLSTAVGDAVDVLQTAMKGGEIKGVQVRAALGVLAALPALRELADIDARLAEIERRQNEIQSARAAAGSQ